MTRNRMFDTPWLLIACCLVACGGDAETPDPLTAAQLEAAEPATPDAPTDSGTPAPAEPDADAAPAVGEADSVEPAIAESDLVHGGTIEIKEYSVAFIGSGSLGKGTLHAGGAAHPFRIGGLGIGGIGVASIDARGNVYNLHDLADFPGAFGKARIGFAVTDKGEGKLWLKNTHGVVLELWSEMAGLALSGGVDGIAIEWEADYQRGLQDVKAAPGKAWEGTKKGAKAAADAVKKPFQ